jgi:hypothetical protein
VAGCVLLKRITCFMDGINYSWEMEAGAVIGIMGAILAILVSIYCVYVTVAQHRRKLRQEQRQGGYPSPGPQSVYYPPPQPFVPQQGYANIGAWVGPSLAGV